MVATRELGIRLSVKDASVVRRALEGLGTEGQQSLRRIERATKPASRGLKAVNVAAKEGQSVLHGYAARLGPLGSILGTVGPAGLAVGAGLGIASGAATLLVGDFAELAERAKVMRESFERMAESRDTNPAQLMTEITKATRGTLDQIGALTVANTALSSGIEPLYKNLGQIIKDTRAVSTALGRNASEDIERVISAINKQEQELLDELGIVARAETAYKTYAKQLGTTASKLDDLQKRTAFANLVIGQLREKATAVGDPINRAAEASERFNSAWTDLKITLGSFVEVGGTLDLLASAIGDVNEAIKETQEEEGPGLLERMGTAYSAAFLKTNPLLAALYEPRGELTEEQRQVAPGGVLRMEGGPPAPLKKTGNPILDFFANGGGSGGSASTSTPPAPETSAGPKTPSLADDFDVDFKFQAQELEEAWEGLSGTARNFEAETILAKKLGELDRQRITDAQELERFDLSRKQNRERNDLLATEADDEQLQVLSAIHAGETELLGARHLSIEATKAQDESDRKLAEGQRLVGRISAETAGVMSRLAPEMRGFFDAAASLATGDIIGGVFGAVHGLLDLFGLARDSTDRLSESVANYAAQMEESSRASQTVIERLFGQTEGYQELKDKALEPLDTLFQDLRRDYPNRSELELVRGLFDAVAQSGSQFKDASFAGDITRGLEKAVEESGMSVHEWQQTLEDVFGSTGTLTDAAQSLFDVRDGFEGVNSAASKLVAGMADVERIAIRSQAQREFQNAGADPFERAAIFNRMSAQLQATIGASESMQRRLRRTGVDTTLAEKVTAGGDVGQPTPVPVTLEQHVVTDFDEMIQLPDRSRRIEIAWEDAVHISSKYGVDGNRPQGWDDIVSRSQVDSMPPMVKKWSDAIDIARVNLSNYGINRWSQMVLLSGESGGLSKHVRDWAQVVDIKQSDLNDYGINRWSQMVLLSGESGGLSKHVRDWAQVIDIKQSDLNDYGINRWSQMVLLSGESGGLSKHVRDWAQVVDIGQSDLSNYGINRWSQMVLLSGESGGLSKHVRDWAQVIDIKQSDLNDYGINRWSQMVLLSRESGGLSKHVRDWAQVVDIGQSDLSNYGINRWSQMVLLSGESGGLSKHVRDWAQVIDIKQSDLNDYGINRWSQMVLLSRESGGLSKHVRSFSDVIDILPSTLNMASMIRLQPIRVSAADLIRITGKLKLSDLIDLSELDRRIDNRVQKSRENRRYRDDDISNILARGG